MKSYLCSINHTKNSSMIKFRLTYSLLKNSAYTIQAINL
jgi:hypothetical protein